MEQPLSRTITREMSISPDVIKEQRWAEAGENLAVLNFSEKVRLFSCWLTWITEGQVAQVLTDVCGMQIIEEKERHLKE